MTDLRKTILSRLLLSGAVAAVLGPMAHADITIEERVSVSGAGLMKMANMAGTTVTAIAGSRARTDSNLQFESGMLRTLARGAGQSGEIVRLDQDKIYTLDPSKKTYTETTFEQRRAQMQEALQQAQEGQASQQSAASGVDESECEWSEPKAEVNKTGERASFGGYQAERVSIVATQTCTNKKTGEACDFGLSLDQWMSPDFAASQETLAYQRAYAQKMGLDAAASKEFSERAEVMFGRYEGMWKEVAAKMDKMEGYPVKSSFGLGVGGPQCQSMQQAQASGGSGGANIGEALGGALGGAIGGMFGKRKKEAAPEPAAAPATMPGGLVSLMTVSTELVSVKTDTIDAQIFEVPAGYKKKD